MTWKMRKLWRVGYEHQQWLVYPLFAVSSRDIRWSTDEEVAKKILAWKEAGPRYRGGNRTTRKEPN